jgi:hypothetical protein
MTSSTTSSQKTSLDFGIFSRTLAFLFSMKGWTFIAIPLMMWMTFYYGSRQVYVVDMMIPSSLHPDDLIYLGDATSASIEIVSTEPFSVMGSVERKPHVFNSERRLDFKYWAFATSDEVGFKVIEANAPLRVSKVTANPTDRILRYESTIGWRRSDVSVLFKIFANFIRFVLVISFYYGLKSIVLTVKPPTSSMR